MSPSPASEADPRPLQGDIRFEEGDFRALTDPLSGDAQYNDRRLITRRKLLALGKGVVKSLKSGGLTLDCRTSLHNPNTFNGMRVRRIWAYLCRAKGEKRRLKSVLGADLAKDLDAAYRNAYLCLAIEANALEVSLRIHPEGWYDGQNLKNRIGRDGADEWRGLLNALGGPWHLRMHDWKGEWRCGELTPDSLEEYLGYYTPGEHRLAIERRWPVPPGTGGALGDGVAEELEGAALSLAPLYRYMAWSKESDFLFG